MSQKKNACMITLYQFPISHFCEKVRWALDYKGLEHRRRNLLLGFHRKAVRRLAPNTHVPILVHGQTVVQNSGNILTYLDRQFSDRSLTPGDPLLREQALDWEKYLDEEIGIQLRRYCYHVLLEYPHALIPVLSQGMPWYAAVLYKSIFPTLRQRMRVLLKITERTAAQSRHRLDAAIKRLHTHLVGRRFLVGDSFTRADLAAASLLAPLCRTAKFGLAWPQTYPEPLEAAVTEWADRLGWVGDFYHEYR